MDSIGRQSNEAPNWRSTVFSSSTTTTISTSTGDELDSGFAFPDDHPHANLPIVNTRSYNQLLDDLSIIDDIYDTFDHDIEHYDKQVVDIARNVAQKYRVAHHLYQREKQYLSDLQTLREGFATWLQQWCNQQSTVETLARNKIAIKDFDLFFGNLTLLTNLHRSFFRRLGDRSAQDVLLQLRAPIPQVLSYSNALAQLTQYTEPSHPDYYALSRLARTFQTRDTNQWQNSVIDLQNHFRAFEAYRLIQGCPALVTAKRRLLIVADLVKIDLADPASKADVRTYFLYNDMLIYCRKLKDKKESGRFLYKGTINLKKAEVRLLSPQVSSRIVDVRRPSAMSSLFTRKNSDSPPQPPPTAYGFDIWMSDICPEAMMDLNLSQDVNFMPVEFNGQIRRRHIIRTHTLAEQNEWVSTLLKVIRSVSEKSTDSAKSP
ncbi:hypothetical protein DFQ28_004220 [Apophysomyces sp. BC1034]|nr:hypothetical protein DFQ30_004187 [Apophysomyces sp. BC1015]KAG0178536.1 hypothetical protein DFQ29_003319 [Apophysomyces sp. BC1021]KAG0188878.1 hypothetical protein DFQ28_004220 [Apophysomyces sp. BC1034]